MEAPRVRCARRGEHALAPGDHLLGATAVDVRRREQANAGVTFLYQWKSPRKESRASRMGPKCSGKPSRYLTVLKLASEYGLS